MGYNRKWGTVESRQPILLVFSGYNRKGGCNRKWGTIKRGHNRKWGTIENTLYLAKDKPHVLNRYFSRSVLIFESFTLQECTRLTKEQKRIDFNWIFYILHRKFVFDHFRKTQCLNIDQATLYFNKNGHCPTSFCQLVKFKER